MKGMVVLSLTPPQARCVNSALALFDADEETISIAGVRPDTLLRTRNKVWDAMDAARVNVHPPSGRRVGTA